MDTYAQSDLQLPPDKLYRYMRFSDRVFRLLLEHRDVFSHVANFNDPLEGLFEPEYPQKDESLEQIHKDLCYEGHRHLNERVQFEKDDGCAVPSDEIRRRLMEYDIRETLADNLNQMGIYCLSETPNSGLMWSHYADSHAGICVEFDTAKFKPPTLRKVCYDVPQRVVVASLFGGIPEVNVLARTLENCLTRKTVEWRYESEWRLIYPQGGIQSLPIQVSGVIFGARTPNYLVGGLAHMLRGVYGRQFLIARSQHLTGTFEYRHHPIDLEEQGMGFRLQPPEYDFLQVL